MIILKLLMTLWTAVLFIPYAVVVAVSKTMIFAGRALGDFGAAIYRHSINCIDGQLEK